MTPRPPSLTLAILFAIALATPATAAVTHGVTHEPIALDLALVAKAQNKDSAEVARVVHAYHEAEKAGDSTAMLALLSDDVVVLEAGGMELKPEFRTHHVAADIAFTRSAQVQRGELRVRVRGDAAWVSSTSTVQRQVSGQTTTSSGAELMVLARENGSWKITAIHWSSRQRRQ